MSRIFKAEINDVILYTSLGHAINSLTLQIHAKISQNNILLSLIYFLNYLCCNSLY